MSTFALFAAQVEKQFSSMSSQELYKLDLDGDLMYQEYLAAFPKGTNELFRERTEHDCSCCKNFIRNLGNVVAIKDNGLVSIWDIEGAEYPYDVVAEHLSGFVKNKVIGGLFRSSEKKYGAEHTFEQRGDKAHKWHHFYGTIAGRHYTKQVGSVCGKAKTDIELFRRGLRTIKPEAIDTILELIKENSLYRGAEFKAAVTGFSDLLKKWSKVKENHDIFLWENVSNPFSGFRNTVIGTLAVDLSEGMDLEAAVRSFESKVAPTNYKRPTALITKGMVDQAMKTIKSLGIEESLQRRYAKISDLSVNNVIWVNNSTQSMMKDGIESLLMGSVQEKPNKGQITEIFIEEFIKNVLPEAVSMSVLFKGNLQSSLMSLTAPVHADSPSIFKWNNNFGWCYKGNITDSIKEKVKRAGGNVNAKVRFSLAWYNYDDLDIHVYTPDGDHIFYGNKRGALDIDMNAGSGKSREAVENVSFNNPKDGKYRIVINQYARRETCDVGFTVEIENNGSLTHLSYPKMVKGDVEVATVTVKDGQITNIAASKEMTSSMPSQEVWGIETETFVEVNTLTFSPNHWDSNEIGNMHYFFILDQCVSDEPARGIYNEFLKSDLDKHRKVFEVLGNKTKCELTNDQVSGLGFSSTRQDSVVAKVTTQSSTKQYKIIF